MSRFIVFEAGKWLNWHVGKKLCLFISCQKLYWFLLRVCPCWYQGNEKADLSAKYALNFHEAMVDIPYSEPIIVLKLTSWWNEVVVSKLLSAKQTYVWQQGFLCEILCKNDPVFWCNNYICEPRFTLVDRVFVYLQYFGGRVKSQGLLIYIYIYIYIYIVCVCVFFSKGILT